MKQVTLSPRVTVPLSPAKAESVTSADHTARARLCDGYSAAQAKVTELSQLTNPTGAQKAELAALQAALSGGTAALQSLVASATDGAEKKIAQDLLDGYTRLSDASAQLGQRIAELTALPTPTADEHNELTVKTGVKTALDAFVQGGAAVAGASQAGFQDVDTWLLQAMASVKFGGPLPTPYDEQKLVNTSALELVGTFGTSHARDRVGQIDDTRPVVQGADNLLQTTEGEAELDRSGEALKLIAGIMKRAFDTGPTRDAPPTVLPDVPGAKKPASCFATTTGGFKVHYMDYPGTDGKPPVFVGPGGPGSGQYLDWVAQNINAAGSRVILWDPPGVGLSDRPTNPTDKANLYTLQNQLQAIDDIRKQIGVDKIRLYGHSYGGVIARGYVSEPQFQSHVDTEPGSVVLADAALGVGTSNETVSELIENTQYTLQRMGALRSMNYAMCFLPLLIQKPAAIDDATWQALTQEALRDQYKIAWGAYAADESHAGPPDAAFLNGSNADVYSDVNASAAAMDPAAFAGVSNYGGKIIVASGTNSLTYPTSFKEVVATLGDKAEPKTLDGLGHEGWIDDPKRYAAFLKDVYGTPS